MEGNVAVHEDPSEMGSNRSALFEYLGGEITR